MFFTGFADGNEGHVVGEILISPSYMYKCLKGICAFYSFADKTFSNHACKSSISSSDAEWTSPLYA